jgi:hypothetical protein
MNVKPSSGAKLTVVLALTVLALAVYRTPGPIAFKPVVAGDVLQLLMLLFVIALFLERALEVFINTWRGARSGTLDHNVQDAQQAVADLTAVPEAKRNAAWQGEADWAAAYLSNARRDVTAYKTRTKQVALQTSFIGGLLVSAVGMRSIEMLVNPDAFKALAATNPFQVSAFHLVDVALTGLVLAGGSDAIHKIMQVYTNFMDATSKKAQAKP